MERKGQAPDLPSSPRAPNKRGRRTPQTIKHVASQGRAAGLLSVRELFYLGGCCWSLFRAIICRSEQSIQPGQLQAPLAETSLECLCMSRGHTMDIHKHICTNTHTHTHTPSCQKTYSSSCTHSPTHSLTHVDRGSLLFLYKQDYN